MQQPPRRIQQRRLSQRGARGVRVVKVSAAAPAVREKPPQSGPATSEDTTYDCVVVGGGISGVVTAQAFVSDHSNTIKKSAAHPSSPSQCFHLRMCPRLLVLGLCVC